MHTLNRRTFLSGIGASVVLSPFVNAQTRSAFEPSFAVEMPDMMSAYLTDRLNALSAKWDSEREEVRTADELHERNRSVRENLLSMLGPFPAKGPGNALVSKTTKRDGYTVENVMFCSRPDFWVTANLYLPSNATGKVPAVLSPCGHYPLARMTPQYQSAYISLARSGFAVLAYDPIGQGERRSYWNPDTDVTEVGGPVFEHSMAGHLLMLVGETLPQYMIWDGMCAIDYLLTRSEVDSEKIGCVGHSGGGTITKFLAVADDRVRCAAILEGGTANQWPTHGLGIADIEQNLFPAAWLGVDNVDLHAAIAPRPLLVAIEHSSPNFDRAVDAIQASYRLMDAEARFLSVVSDDPHSWTPKLRLATIQWFNRWLRGTSGPSAENFHETLSAEELYCTSKGSLLAAQKGKTIFEVLSANSSRYKAQQKESPNFGEIRDRISSLIGCEKVTEPLRTRHIATTTREGYIVEKKQILSAAGIYIPAWVFQPSASLRTFGTILYISDEGMASEGMEFEGSESAGTAPGAADHLVHAGYCVILVDVRGIGETRPQYNSSLTSLPFGQLFDADTSMAYAAWSMKASLLGMRVADVIRSVDFAFNLETDGKRLTLIGKGRGALWSLFAAALDDRILRTFCFDSLVSYQALANSDRNLYGADVVIADVLSHFDLPDVAAAVAPRKLTLIDLRGPMKNLVPLHEAKSTYRNAYRSAVAAESFQVAVRTPGLNAGEECLRLILEEKARTVR